ncbi:GDSL-type esterase/lipase family protein [Stigmatella sp. ncwal1]|uniref:GDSL-type esterase/lipase family protein n=1 Tax=Stigmatella ashevillensis TaxID=2995309 RepID=A0ABT5DAI2_9BACT|nr:GDSL-type esterase/lipase family protein [Stigmatella ashevillena]MDC0710680.1 GDSL-type esterase/lipase family protein [Stigmatella ashevillena]
MNFKATSTGWTLVLTGALALGLSLAPLPESLRPLPSLSQEGPLAPRLAALVLPRILTGGPAAAPPPQDVLTATPQATPGTPDALPPEEDEPSEPEETETPTVMAPPSDLEGLGAATRARALSLEGLRERVGSQHVDIALGCRRMGPSGCEESGLAPFFRTLSELHEDRRRAPVRVVHLGDSLIASDHITDVIRERLQERHGSGGKGLLYIDRPTGAGRTVRAGTASEGWQITRIIDRNYPKERLGFTGVAFASNGTSSQSARFPAEGARTAELFFQTQPQGGTVMFSADGKPLQRLLTHFDAPQMAFARVDLPEGTKTLSLHTTGKVELHGVSMESGRPGIVYDTIGLPGATAEVFLRAKREAFRAQLRHRKPSLVVLMVGGNEAFYLSRDRTKPADIRSSAMELVKWVRESVPDSACLVMSPLDAAVRTMGGELVPRRGTQEVGGILRDVAREGGCAYWDSLAAMGGEGSAIRWLPLKLLNEDLVHPRAKGSDLMGHLFDFALQRAYAREHSPLLQVEDPSGLLDSDTSLRSTFAHLRALENKAEGERLDIVQLGAPDTDLPGFTGAVHGALAKRFGAKDPGITYDALEESGATAFTLNPPESEAEALAARLAARKPQLLVFRYGTLEAVQPDLDTEALHQEYTAAISRLRAATGAECLLMGPPDRLQQDPQGRWTEAVSLGRVLSTLPRVARDAGCAYWSSRAAMGGERSMLRWQREEPALAEPDGTLLTAQGAERLASAFVKELLAGYEASKATSAEAGQARVQTKGTSPVPAPTAHAAEGG